MQLEGSCHCGAVQFSLESANPYPYQRCYCSICRKTQGGGGYAINLSGDARTLKLKGGDHVAVYHAVVRDGQGAREGVSSAERHFCSHCGSALWLFSPEWPDLIHPFASAIDTNLPVPPERTHLFLDSKASWVEIEAKQGDKLFKGYPEESIARWHERLGLETPGASVSPDKA
ncbi:GFA family protein [Allopusillimonas soli]|uniref:GFA family protein n=1 Tax=Allopusillimonas soli TaxID=659016 RepID=A0A853FHM8_9BURK|nr:GFA family protein [Allopusillimonas soli]NYT37941.1 GFA family protein [Allopusillimonas soli]TEA73840.1 GFA family protein [Allopusillimonas soli]